MSENGDFSEVMKIIDMPTSQALAVHSLITNTQTYVSPSTRGCDADLRDTRSSTFARLSSVHVSTRRDA